MYHFIVNENAAAGKGFQIWEELKETLHMSQIEYGIYFPKNKRESFELISKLSSGDQENHLIVVGGDGTLNNVLQGIQNFDKVKLSCIPIGSGNDFARGQGISFEPKRALKHILNNPVETVMDYGETTMLLEDGSKKTYRFMISTGAGYDAEICQEVNGSEGKRLLNHFNLGKLSYLITGIKKIIGRESCSAKLTLDGEREIYLKDMFLIVAMNTPYEGGGVPFCPMANWTDGVFDLCVVRSMNVFKLSLAIVSVYLKQHFWFRQISHYRCHDLKIQMSKSRWVHFDGETPHKVKTLKVKCHHGLRVVI